MNSRRASLIESRNLSPAGRFQMKEGASRNTAMLRCLRYLSAGRTVQVEISQVLMVRTVKRNLSDFWDSGRGRGAGSG